jgi:hypothetical protein
MKFEPRDKPFRHRIRQGKSSAIAGPDRFRKAVNLRGDDKRAGSSSMKLFIVILTSQGTGLKLLSAILVGQPCQPCTQDGLHSLVSSVLEAWPAAVLPYH